MKTRIIFTINSPYHDFSIGDTGYVDGYVRGADNLPYAIIVLDSGKFVFSSISYFKSE